MTYNKDALLQLLSNAPLYGGMIFHEGDNESFLTSMGPDFCNQYSYEYGASKFVLIPFDDNEKYVIKIPYTGSYNFESGYYSSSSSQHYHSGTNEYCDYYGSDYDERPWDYCAGEVQRYKKAEKYGLAECFAKTEFLGYVNDYPIYIQEKCTVSSYYKNSHSVEEQEKTSKCCGTYKNINNDWLTDFRIYYGEEILLKFINFIHDNDWDDDLRKDNIGYIENRPVLIDYSGFFC